MLFNMVCFYLANEFKFIHIIVVLLSYCNNRPIYKRLADSTLIFENSKADWSKADWSKLQHTVKSSSGS